MLVGAHREREVELARWQRMLENLSAFELLLLASLYTYERLVPHTMTGQSSVAEGGGQASTLGCDQRPLDLEAEDDTAGNPEARR